MKLIFCDRCHDVYSLSRELKKCSCSATSGHYADNGIDAVIQGCNAISIGFQNSSFVKALRNRPQNGLEYRFEAFVIPIECETIEHIV